MEQFSNHNFTYTSLAQAKSPHSGERSSFTQASPSRLDEGSNNEH